MDLVGIDIGGTKISICLGDQRGKIYEYKKVATASFGNADKGLPKLVSLIQEFLSEYGVSLKEIRGLGLALPGPLSIKEGRLLNPPNMPGWVNVPIGDYLKMHLQRPIFVDNDANAGALAEWAFGGREGIESLVYLTMSTGMGAGILFRGQVIQGRTDTAGEVGHFVLDPNGPTCVCGHKGCFEAFCGGAAVACLLRKEMKKKGCSDSLILQEAKGDVETIDMKCLLSAVRKKDPFACRFWDQYIERFSQGVGMIIQFFNPDALILGTIAVHHQDLVIPPLKSALPDYAWKTPIESCCIEPTRLGKDLGLLGALSVAIHGLGLMEKKRL